MKNTLNHPNQKFDLKFLSDRSAAKVTTYVFSYHSLRPFQITCCKVHSYIHTYLNCSALVCIADNDLKYMQESDEYTNQLVPDGSGRADQL